ncbi:Aste57867_21139 [Aphanomyces stellatus]|uniref:Aste57867_21139 protein n=1 Tax=Aphanomyces stellatus TaxID=120398 RepID=A0A485LHB9_9STRA|nr:hypothetical protein As57867_021071 [Aphanomyces stellatus]VFT97813.1 Aste57867_21139 [Aphanomyces stellatus]
MNAPPVVSLNVGGRVFQTSRATLLRQEGSYFDAMLSSGQWQPDAQGAYFIDLDPTHFARVLNYLRFGDLALDGLANWEVIELMRMLQYLSLEPPSSLGLLWDPCLCGRIAPSNQCRTITAAPSFVPFAALGLQSTDVYSLQIDAMTFESERASIRVGFADDRDHFDPSQPTAWFIDIRLIGPEQYTMPALAPSRPPHVLFANVGDVITVRWVQDQGRLVGHKHGDRRTVASTDMPRAMLDGGLPFPCVALLAAQTTNFTTSAREWATARVSFVETPPPSMTA